MRNDFQENSRSNLQKLRAVIFAICICALILWNDFYFKIFGNIPKDLANISTSGNSSTARKEYLANLSEKFQADLANIQNPKDCSGPSLLCGHNQNCGLGCQIHHRIACLMISYSLQLPLIHDQYNYWPYDKKWKQTFRPLGSACPIDLETTTVVWNNRFNYKPLFKWANGRTKDMKFPIANGIPIPKDFADLVDAIHPKPFLWWVGQFLKFGLRLIPSEIKIVEEAKKSINFTHPIVGIQVRIGPGGGSMGSQQEIEEAFAEAEKYFANLSAKGVIFSTKRVFVQTDYPNVLFQSQWKYPSPEWDVIGYNDNKNLETRAEVLDQMIKNLYTLAECDFVVCTFSSQICRVVLELKNIDHLDGIELVVSLNDTDTPRTGYSYPLMGTNIPDKIIKV